MSNTFPSVRSTGFHCDRCQSQIGAPLIRSLRVLPRPSASGRMLSTLSTLSCRVRLTVVEFVTQFAHGSCGNPITLLMAALALPQICHRFWHASVYNGPSVDSKEGYLVDIHIKLVRSLLYKLACTYHSSWMKVPMGALSLTPVITRLSLAYPYLWSVIQALMRLD